MICYLGAAVAGFARFLSSVGLRNEKLPKQIKWRVEKYENNSKMANCFDNFKAWPASSIGRLSTPSGRFTYDSTTCCCSTFQILHFFSVLFCCYTLSGGSLGCSRSVGELKELQTTWFLPVRVSVCPLYSLKVKLLTHS